MSRKLIIAAALLLVSSIQPLLADPSDVQVVGTSVSNAQITIHVANTGTSATPLRVQVSVLVAGGSTQVLTTETVTVPASATATVTVTAADTVVEITDDPEPILP